MEQIVVHPNCDGSVLSARSCVIYRKNGIRAQFRRNLPDYKVLNENVNNISGCSALFFLLGQCGSEEILAQGDSRLDVAFCLRRIFKAL